MLRIQSPQYSSDFNTLADRETYSSQANHRLSTSFLTRSFNCMTKSPLGSFFTPTTPALSAFYTTRYSIVLFIVVYIAFRSIGSITHTLTYCKRLSSSVGSGGRLATLAHEGLFEVFEGVAVVIAIEEALPSFRIAL
jgi:hypothetical protein